METNRSYRIRTKVGQSDGELKIDLPLIQSYDTLEILSLKLSQKNEYKFYDSQYGIVVGRVLLNEGFGCPNAKVSIFIPFEDDSDTSYHERFLYNFRSTEDKSTNFVRYNLLPESVDNACHQDVGTFPSKRLVLDNNDIIEIFDKYYKYTTTTNNSGDYMLYGVPVGEQEIHVDVDLSDIGTLSQRPRDMIAKGYNINMFESPNKFRKSTNLDSLSQIYTQNRGLNVYPYWGNTNSTNEDSGGIVALTRCDIQIDYKIEPTAIFMGSIVTDKGSNSIGKNCTGTEKVGTMSELIAGEGKIEMIRIRPDGKVEEYPISGNRLIDGNGTWCYQIPMNLDYVTTDEFGNLVATDNPTKGIPTRARVRFRITMDENPEDTTGHKRCSYLVPNNPRFDEERYPKFCVEKEADYDFGTNTREESYCDMYWNNVYTVKNYIPRIQKDKSIKQRKHTAIKATNRAGDNNPFPYNSLNIKLPWTFSAICIITKIIIYIVGFINTILWILCTPLCWASKALIKTGKFLTKTGILSAVGAPIVFIGQIIEGMVVTGIKLGNQFCDDGINKNTYYPLLFKVWHGSDFTKDCVLGVISARHGKEDYEKLENGRVDEITKFTPVVGEKNALMTCLENSLAQTSEAISFNFSNDWVNGVLYAPIWHRRIKPKRKYFFGWFVSRAKNEWCDAAKSTDALLFQNCALKKKMGNPTGLKSPYNDKKYDYPIEVTDDGCDKSNKCHEENFGVDLDNGIIVSRETILKETVYYYKSVEYNSSLKRMNNDDAVALLFATDIVLLGSLNDCDSKGIPQFYRYLEPSTFKLPTDILFTDLTIQLADDGSVTNQNLSGPEYSGVRFVVDTESTGNDWGNLNSDECGKFGEADDGGLFYGIGCTMIEMKAKTCLNLSRICELGVELDSTKHIPNLHKIKAANPNSNLDIFYTKLIPDGFISYDELVNNDPRSMFATLNGNRLRTKMNKNTGYEEYDLVFLYPNNFDGLAYKYMRKDDKGCNYSSNYHLENFSKDYYLFRMGFEPYYYDREGRFPRYENSYYFYFGLKNGKTAIERFYSQFFAPCEDPEEALTPIGIESKANSWCKDNETDGNGYILLDMTKVEKPYTLILNSVSQTDYGVNVINCSEDKLFLGHMPNLSLQDQDYVKRIFFENKFSTPINDINLIKKNINSDTNNGENGDEENGNVENNGNNENNNGNTTSNTRTIDCIINGEYELTVTDASGKIMTEKIEVFPKTLTFLYEREHNIIDNITRMSKSGYEALYDELNKNYKDFGGYIKITNINNGSNTALCENEKYGYYKIAFGLKKQTDILDFDTIYKNGNENDNQTNNWAEFVSKNRAYVYVKVDSDGNLLEIVKEKDDNGQFIDTSNLFTFEKDNNDVTKNKLIVIVPKGGVIYNVEVTEICGCNCTDNINSEEEDSEQTEDNGENYDECLRDSNNVQVVSILIEDILPFKLFVNELDISALKLSNTSKAWETGSSISGNKCSYNNPLSNDSIWLHLTEYLNGEKSKDYYDLNFLEGYSASKQEAIENKKRYEEVFSEYNTFVNTTINEGDNEVLSDHIKEYNNKVNDYTDIQSKYEITKKELSDVINVIKDKIYDDYRLFLSDKPHIYNNIQERYMYVNQVLKSIQYDEKIDINGMDLLKLNDVIYENKKDEEGNIIYEKDEDGNDKLDENNQPIPVKIPVYERCISNYNTKLNDVIKTKENVDEMYIKYQIQEFEQRYKPQVEGVIEEIKKITGNDYDEWTNNLNEGKAINGYDAVIKNLPDNSELTLEIENNFKETLKNAFWVTCNGGYKTINIRVQSNSVDSDVHVELYRYDEVEDEDDVDLHLLETGTYNTDEESLQMNVISSIAIPTITFEDDKDYGNTDNNNTFTREANEKLCIAKAKIDSTNNKTTKGIYAVRAYSKNSGVSLPKIGNGKIDNKQFFFFHLIDKRLDCNVGTWSAIKNMPFYDSNYNGSYVTNDEKRGKMINMQGFLAGYVYNGILDEKGNFEESTIGSDSFVVITPDNTNEDAMPIKRFIDTNSDGGKPYNNFNFNNTSYLNPYFPINNNTRQEFTIRQGDGCTIKKYLTPNYQLNYDVLNITQNTNATQISFKFIRDNILNNGENTVYNYYVINNNDYKHPLTYDMSYDNGKWVKDCDGDALLNFKEFFENTKFGEGRQIDLGGGRKIVPVKEEINDENTVISSLQFIDINVNVSDKININGTDYYTGKFYVICVSDQNERTITPLFDYQPLVLKTILTTVYNVDKNYRKSDASQITIKYSENNTPYYIMYYDHEFGKFTINYDGRSIDVNNNNLLPFRENYILYQNNSHTDLLPFISRMNSIGALDTTFNVTVDGVIDCTKLKLPVISNDVSLERLYNVWCDYSSLATLLKPENNCDSEMSRLNYNKTNTLIYNKIYNENEDIKVYQLDDNDFIDRVNPVIEWLDNGNKVNNLGKSTEAKYIEPYYIQLIFNDNEGNLLSTQYIKKTGNVYKYTFDSNLSGKEFKINDRNIANIQRDVTIYPIQYLGDMVTLSDFNVSNFINNLIKAKVYQIILNQTN